MPDEIERLDAITHAVEVLNRVEYGGGTREPASGMTPFEMSDVEDKDSRASPLDVWLEAIPALEEIRDDVTEELKPMPWKDFFDIAGMGLGEVGSEVAESNVGKPWKTLLFGGEGEVFGGPKGSRFPGYLGVYNMGAEGLEWTGLPQWLHDEQLDMGLLEEGTTSRALLTDPFLLAMGAKPFVPKQVSTALMSTKAGVLNPVVPTPVIAERMAKAGFTPEAVSKVKEAFAPAMKASRAVARQSVGLRNLARWAMKGDESGAVLNPYDEFLKVAGKSRTGTKGLYGRSWEYMEDLIWNRARTKNLRLFKGGIRDWAAKNFMTARAQYGPAYADGLQDIYSARSLAQFEVKPAAARLKEIVPEEFYRDVSRYMRPRVVGAAKVWPTDVSLEAKRILDEMAPLIDDLGREAVELRGLSPAAWAEYRGNYYPRRFMDKAFYQEGTKAAVAPAKRTFFAKDAYGVRVKMTKEEAEALMKGTGGAQLPLEQQMKPRMEAVEEWWDTLTKGEKRKVLPHPGHGKKATMEWGSLEPEEWDDIARAWDRLEGPPKTPAENKLNEVFRNLEEAGVLENRIGPEAARGSALQKTDLIKGRAELDPMYSGQKGAITLVKFGDDAGDATGKALADEFAKRAKNAGYKIHSRFDPLPDDVLRELGEIEDPAANLFEAIAQGRIRNAKLRFFKTLSEATDAQGKRYALTQAEAAKGNVTGWQTIKQEQRWGYLQGMQVRPDVYRDITSFDRTVLTEGQKVWRKLLSEFKSGKTIWSLRTHVRNFFGNVPFSVLADNTAPWAGGFHNYKYYRDAFKALRDKNSPMYREMLEKGIVGTQYGDQELAVFAPIFKAETTSANGIAQKLARAFDRTPVLGKNSVLTQGKPAEFMARLYNFEDAMYRASTYHKARTAWGMSESEAAAWVNKWYPNYAEVGAGVKKMRLSWWGGPFSSFGAESLRIMHNAMIEKPVRLALVTFGAPYVYSQMAQWELGMSDDEYDEVRGLGPQTVPAPRRSDAGHIQSIPLEYWNPFGPVMTGLSGNRYTEESASQLLMQSLELARPFFFANPVFTAATAGITMAADGQGIDPFTGRPIRRRGEGFIHAMGGHTYRQFMPGFTPGIPGVIEGGNEWEKMSDLVQGLNFRGGQKRTLGKTLLDVVAGLGVRERDPRVEKERLQRYINYLEMKENMELSGLDRALKEQSIGQREYDRDYKGTQEEFGNKLAALFERQDRAMRISRSRNLGTEKESGMRAKVRRILDKR
jgi:hypothetical protein